MAQYLSPFAGRQFLDSNGDPYVGALLFTYAAGSSTKVTTTKDSAGASNHTNPIVLNARGEPANGAGASQAIWQTGGAAVKYVLAPSTDSDPPLSAISTWDNISGINDTTITIDQWISGPTPTYVGATQFTLVGDQTSAFHVGRRIKATVTAGTVYGTITVSAYTSLTTITVVLDSGALDSGLSAVYYGILTATNPSIPGVEISGDDWTHQGNVTHEGTVTMQSALNVSGITTIGNTGSLVVSTGTAGNVWTTGDVKLTLKSVADSSWVMMNDGTIGNAASGATTRANADTVGLYTLLWNNIIDTWCAVSTGRGASAAADYAANKTITLPRMLGRALAISGTGATLTARALGEYLGAQTHALTTAELASHSHRQQVSIDADTLIGASFSTGAGGNSFYYPAGSVDAAGATGVDINSGAAGSGTAHNNMQPSSFLNVMIKL